MFIIGQFKMSNKVNNSQNRSSTTKSSAAIKEGENLNNLVNSSLFEPLSDEDAAVISGGCPWIRPGFPGLLGWS